MTLELGLTLAALALVDSLSIGTLLIPLFFLVTPGRVRAGRVLLYLATIAGFYLLVGLALTAGADTLLRDAAGLLETPVARWVQLVAGAALLTGSFFIGRTPRSVDANAAATRPAGAATHAPAASTASGESGRAVGGVARDSKFSPRGTAAGSASPDAARAPGRLARWRDRAMAGGSPAIVVGLALAAGVVELATMLPYLGAVGMITAAGLPPAAWIAVLAAYCAVMIAPALVLLTARVAAGRLVEPPLRRLTGWLERNSAENTAWIVGIVGFLLARDAATQLGLFGLG